MSLRASINKQLKRFEKEMVVYNTISVSRSALLHNFDFYARLSPGGMVIPVLKANAYGHGLEQVAEILQERHFPYIAVDGYFEGLRIHEASKQPVLVMGAIDPRNFASINPKNFAFVLHDKTTLKAMMATGKKYKVHLEIETGMGRHGIRPDELASFLTLIKGAKKLHVEGVMTHLADADNPRSKKHVELQTARFDKAVEQVREAGFSPKYLHIAQSAGSVKVRSRYANTLRVGIGLYGITPLEKSDKSAARLDALKPVLTLASTIAKVLEVDAGESVGYGCTFVAPRKSRIGVLPLGYYEGLPRALSNMGKVKWHGQYLPIVGRVCMNHTMIDLTDSKATAGDRVVVISTNKRDMVNVNAICEESGLFSYTFLVGLNQNIRRSIVE